MDLFSSSQLRFQVITIHWTVQALISGFRPLFLKVKNNFWMHLFSFRLKGFIILTVKPIFKRSSNFCMPLKLYPFKITSTQITRKVWLNNYLSDRPFEFPIANSIEISQSAQIVGCPTSTRSVTTPSWH